MKKFLIALGLATGLSGAAFAQATVPSVAPPPVPTVPPVGAPHALTGAPVPSTAPAEIVAPAQGVPSASMTAGPAHAAPFSGSPVTGSELGTSPVPAPGKAP